MPATSSPASTKPIDDLAAAALEVAAQLRNEPVRKPRKAKAA